MDETLMDLWNGDIKPYLDLAPNTPARADLTSRVLKAYEDFKTKLPAENAEDFSKYAKLSAEQFNEEQGLAFCTGFRLGAKMMIEVLMYEEAC